MAASLLFGGLQLLDQTPNLPPGSAGRSVNYVLNASADGTNWGNAERIVAAIRSHLQDGSLASVTSQDNRMGSIKVRIEASTYDELAAGEAALMAQTKVAGFNTLEWTPNLALARPTVFDVVYSYMDFNFDDFDETVLRRTYVLTLAMLPFGRDKTAATVTATTPSSTTPPTITSIDAGTSTTAWSGQAVSLGGSTTSPTPTSTGAYVELSTFPGANAKMTLTRTGSITMGTDTVIAIDWLTTGSPASVRLNYTVGGVTTGIDPVSNANQVSGFSRAYFSVPSGLTITALSLIATVQPLPGYAITRLRIDQVSRQNAIPANGTPRQQSRSLVIGGSARARASLVITAGAGTVLGDTTMIYTRSATTGLQPPLRPYLVSSAAVIADTSLISGNYQSLGGTASVYRIPAAQLRQSAYDLVGRLRATTAGTYTIAYTASLKSSAGATLPETSQTVTGTVSVTFATANVMQTVELGLLALPTVPVDTDSTHVIELSLAASSTVVQLDEGWLFDLDNGLLSWVDTTGLTRLEARTADLNLPEPSYWGGTVDGGTASGLVRADYRVTSFGVHVFEPGAIDVFTVTSSTLTSLCQATYCRAWHTHAGA